MACSEASRPVFVDTSLGTHLAVPVSPETTAAELKRELEKLHDNCFPEIGSVIVDALMVKRRSRYYHLSESLPVKYGFQGLTGTWFMRVEVHKRIIKSQRSQRSPVECHGIQDSLLDSVAEGVDSDEVKSFLTCTDKNKIKCKRKNGKRRRLLHIKFPALRIYTLFCLLKRRKKMKRIKRNYEVGCHGRAVGKKRKRKYAAENHEVNRGLHNDSQKDVETRDEMVPESVSVSVSGILKKYFSDYDEVVSSARYPFASVRNTQNEGRINADFEFVDTQSDLVPQVKGHKYLQQEKPSSESMKNKRKKPEVGKRLLLASNSLGLTPRRQQAVLSLCKSSCEKSPVYRSSATTRSLVFEITEEDD